MEKKCPQGGAHEQCASNVKHNAIQTKYSSSFQTKMVIPPHRVNAE